MDNNSYLECKITNHTHELEIRYLEVHDNMINEEMLNRQLVTLDLLLTPSNGINTYFICPGCERRRRALYLIDDHFICRNCCNLQYSSNYRSRRQRLVENALKNEKYYIKVALLHGEHSVAAKNAHQTYKKARELTISSVSKLIDSKNSLDIYDYVYPLSF